MAIETAQDAMEKYSIEKVRLTVAKPLSENDRTLSPPSAYLLLSRARSSRAGTSFWRLANLLGVFDRILPCLSRKNLTSSSGPPGIASWAEISVASSHTVRLSWRTPFLAFLRSLETIVKIYSPLHGTYLQTLTNRSWAETKHFIYFYLGHCAILLFKTQ